MAAPALDYVLPKLIMMGDAPQEVVVSKFPFTIGKQDCNLCVNAPEVANQHCRLTLKGASLWVRNLAPSAVLLVNDQPAEESALEPGDRLSLGTLSFVVVYQKHLLAKLTGAKVEPPTPISNAPPKPKPAPPAPRQGPSPAPSKPKDHESQPATFVERLRASQILAPHVLKEALAEMEASGASDDEIGPLLVEQELLTPWQFQKLKAGNWKGFVVDNYRLCERLGGEGSRVYLAYHAGIKRHAALKVLNLDFQARPEQQAAFCDKAKTLASLDHPHLVRVYDVNMDDDFQYVMMEYLKGQTLKDLLLAEGKQTIEMATAAARQVAEALTLLHAQGVPHGRIKPGNIIIDEEQVVRLINLGFGRQWKSTETDYQQDFSGLGRLIFQLVSGRSPHEHEYSASAVKLARSDVPDDLAELCAQLMLHPTEGEDLTMEAVRDALRTMG